MSFFAGNSFSGVDVGRCVTEILERCHSIGLDVVALTTDMGSGNRNLWKHLGVHAGRLSRVRNEFPHPSDRSKKIAVFADVPHVVKNLCGHLLRNQTITIPKAVAQANGLPSETVSLAPIEKLINQQKNQTFKLAPKLKPELLAQNQFERMKASEKGVP